MKPILLDNLIKSGCIILTMLNVLYNDMYLDVTLLHVVNIRICGVPPGEIPENDHRYLSNKWLTYVYTRYGKNGYGILIFLIDRISFVKK